MSDQQSEKCENRPTQSNGFSKVIAPVVCKNVERILLDDFIEWLDDQLFELELKYTDFQTQDSLGLKASHR